MKLKSAIGFTLSLCILFAIGCSEVSNKILEGTDTDPDAGGLISISRDDAPVDASKLWGDVVILEHGVNDPDKWGNDDYRLNSTTITDSTFTVSVSYSGGCKNHQFTLILMDSWKMSDPAQLGVSIVHNANRDSCEAYPTEEYHFDLTPIKTMYQATHPQKAGRVLLKLESAPEDTSEFIYEFTE